MIYFAYVKLCLQFWKGESHALKGTWWIVVLQSYEPTNPAESGTYKAQSPGKLAQHNEAQDSGDRVNAAVV